MKLLRAEFRNFRLLRDLELEFSSDAARKLTVIRAANESGKTTVLHALQWALYGDSALPGKGEDFRLHPIDWNANEGRRIPITATVEFELTTYRRVSGDVRETRRRYRLVRSAFEDVDDQARRAASTVKLFALNYTGTRPIDAPEALINEELPPELREIFFTDGDRALSFIEADVALSTKRDRVERAIRSLLGLGVIANAIKHVHKSATEVNKKAKQVGSGNELAKVASRLDAIEIDREKLDADFEDAKQQFGAFDEKVDEMDRRIAAALQKGDREQLQKDLDRTKREIKRLDEQIVAGEQGTFDAVPRPRDCDRSSCACTRPRFREARTTSRSGKIPNTTILCCRTRLRPKSASAARRSNPAMRKAKSGGRISRS